MYTKWCVLFKPRDKRCMKNIRLCYTDLWEIIIFCFSSFCFVCAEKYTSRLIYMPVCCLSCSKNNAICRGSNNCAYRSQITTKHSTNFCSFNWSASFYASTWLYALWLFVEYHFHFVKDRDYSQPAYDRNVFIMLLLFALRRMLLIWKTGCWFLPKNNVQLLLFLL